MTTTTRDSLSLGSLPRGQGSGRRETDLDPQIIAAQFAAV